MSNLQTNRLTLFLLLALSGCVPGQGSNGSSTATSVGTNTKTQTSTQTGTNAGTNSGTQTATQTATQTNSTTQTATATAIQPPPTAGRAIPSPLYGVTLDDVSNMSGILASLQRIPHMPTARIVFDYGQPPSYYAGPIQQIRPSSYVMGQLADSTDMKKYTTSTFQTKARNFVAALGSQVDVWEVGNEVNGNWLGSGTAQKISAAYSVVSAANGATALTFFYMGEPGEANNCIDAPGDDMFTWINNSFQLNLPPAQRDPQMEKLRLGLNYALISWYPDGCPGENPNWPVVYGKLAQIFPNAKVGFGELGTQNAQGGSQFELSLINQYYPMAKTMSGLPPAYVGGYFWWYFAEEMVPYTTNMMSTLDQAIQAGPAPGSP
jgi:hypothetical protein